MALAAPALAADPAPTILHLDQTAERIVPRDRLTVDLRAEATGADPRAVQAEVNRRMTAALAKVKGATAVKAASGNYSTYQTTPSGPDGKPKPPAQWHATQELTLVSRDFPAALALAGQLQADGLLIGDMRFDIAPETLHAQQQVLTDEALTALTARAGQVAATLHLPCRGYQVAQCRQRYAAGRAAPLRDGPRRGRRRARAARGRRRRDRRFPSPSAPNSRWFRQIAERPAPCLLTMSQHWFSSRLTRFTQSDCCIKVPDRVQASASRF